jgi:hypothetical protein
MKHISILVLEGAIPINYFLELMISENIAGKKILVPFMVAVFRLALQNSQMPIRSISPSIIFSGKAA